MPVRHHTLFDHAGVRRNRVLRRTVGERAAVRVKDHGKRLTRFGDTRVLCGFAGGRGARFLCRGRILRVGFGTCTVCLRGSIFIRGAVRASCTDSADADVFAFRCPVRCRQDRNGS